MKYLLSLITMLTIVLPSHAVTCNRLAKQYSIGVNTSTGVDYLTLKIISKVTKTEYSGTIINNIGAFYNAIVVKQCNHFYAVLPVSVYDNVGLDGDVGDYYDFNYQCSGAIRPNGSIAGGCNISGTYAEIHLLSKQKRGQN